ncbi:hypothetical protein BJ962_003644 [Streptomyces aureorectus]|nr:hypothetical protein [Streptomyces calvus]
MAGTGRPERAAEGRVVRTDPVAARTAVTDPSLHGLPE